MAVAFVVVVFSWFATAIEAYTGLPAPAALGLMALAAPLLEPQFVTFAVARHVVRRAGAPSWHVALAGASVWIGTEWVCGKLFGDTIGQGLYGSSWMRQGADLAGVAGLTLVLLLANESVLVALRGRALAPAACFVALLVGLLGYGAVRCRQLAVHAGGAPLTAGIVQANIGHYDRMRAYLGTFEAVRAILDTHFALSTTLLRRGNVDVLLWGETVYPTTFGSPKSPDGAAFDREIARFVAGARVPLVFGAYDVEAGAEFNAAFFLQPPVDGRLTFDTYRKAALFPLTERVPRLLESSLVRRWLPWLGTWKPGQGGEVVPLALADGRTVRVAPLICYDVLEPRYALAAVRRGAELIVTLSNDSWFDIGSGPRLHLVGAAFRSIETRRPQVRATNTGISAVIDATGALVATAGVHEQRTLAASVTPVGDVTTLVLAWGDWLGPTALVIAVLLLGRALIGGALAS